MIEIGKTEIFAEWLDGSQDCFKVVRDFPQSMFTLESRPLLAAGKDLGYK